jgi:hypothetical protein
MSTVHHNTLSYWPAMRLWRCLSTHSFPYKLLHFCPAPFFLDTWPSRVRPIRCPKTSVLNWPMLCNNPKDGTIQVQHFSLSPASFVRWDSNSDTDPSEPTNKHKYS